MKTNSLHSKSSFRLLLVILGTLGFLIVLVCGIRSASAAEIPFDPNEVQKLRAFLGSQSMTPGKTNADLLGVDINNPGTWAKWIEKEGLFTLPAKQVTEIKWKCNFLAGSLDISDFTKLGYFVLDGIAEITNKFDKITIRNNPALGGVILNGVKVDELVITENQSLQSLALGSKVDVLILEQPKLTYLEIGTLGTSPIDLTRFTSLYKLVLSDLNLKILTPANFPALHELNISGTDISHLDFKGCANLKILSLNMPKLQSINLNCESLDFLGIAKTSIKELDLTNVPNLAGIECVSNLSLSSLKIENKPNMVNVKVYGNSALHSLQLNNLAMLVALRCHDNESLSKLILHDMPQLDWIYCYRNALTSLDVSGLPALKILLAATNQLSEFIGSGIDFEQLDLLDNKFTEVSANANGKKIHLKAYEKGGYVGFSAYPAQWAPYGIDLDWKGLPAPYNTVVKKAEGKGLPTKENAWKSSFPFNSDIDATFYFSAEVHLLHYFERPEDNPYFEYGLGVNVSWGSIVGDPIFFPSSSEFPSPSKTGFVIQGWYTDSTFTHEWIFGKDILRGELTLYPNWIPKGMPVVVSVKRQIPTTENTSNNKVTYQVTFSKTVSGIDISDFKLTTEGTVTGKIASVSAANGNTISVEVNTISGTGTLRLDVKSTGTGITDADSNPLAGGYTSGEMYRLGSATTIDNNFRAEKSYRVFPNPTSGIIQIYTPDNEPISRGEIFSIQGQKITSINFPESNSVDLSGLKTGIYILKLVIDEKIFVREILKK